MSDNSKIFIEVNGKKVDRQLLESRTMERCIISECQSWCCSGGVWVDIDHKKKILDNAEAIKRHLPSDRHDVSIWFDGEIDHSKDYPSGMGEGTQIVNDVHHPAGTTCVFLRPEDRYCALQVTSIARGEHPWALKPFYCALHPVTIDDGNIMLDDDNDIYITGGHCQRAAPTAKPMYITLESEMKLALGDDGYSELLKMSS